MSTVLNLLVNGTTLSEIKERAVPLIQHFLELEDRDPFDIKSLEISIEAEPMVSPDATVRTFVGHVTVVKS